MILWSRVHELREEIGEDDFAEVVHLFLDEVETSLASLAVGSTSTAEDLHFVKGSALNLGFGDLATACMSAEQGEFDQLTIGKLHSIYTESKAAFLAELSGLKGIDQGGL